MNPRHPAIAALALLCACIGPAAAQSQTQSEALRSATELANGIKAATGVKPAAKQLPAGDPCGILSQADVQKFFPGAKAGERSKRLEEYGITECAWKGPSGQIAVVVQESYNSGTSAKEDALGMAQGFTDPLKPKSLKNVRIESFPALGDAAAFVETADASRGILGDGALMELRKGRHNISIGSGELPRRDRAAALKIFEELGRVAAKRL
ncbi:MAG: hypothetical protein M3Z29_08585 [Pseudomonadota bacterium]|nr:hypothetical protein [Pseudomonadota bacterium]